MPYFWDNSAWDDYLYWQSQDKKTLKKINALLRDIERSHGEKGDSGKAEILKETGEGLRSARIDSKNRPVYRAEGDTVYVVSCRGHYKDR